MGETGVEELTAQRDLVVGEMRRQLVGPANGPRELVVGQPVWRYMAGMLFSHDTDEIRRAVDEEEDGPSIASQEEALDENVAKAYDLLPASMGCTFFIMEASGIRCRVSAGAYSRIEVEDILAERASTGTDKVRSQALDAFIAAMGGEEKLDAIKTKLRSSRVWSRSSLPEDPSGELVAFTTPPVGEAAMLRQAVFSGRAEVTAQFRPRGSGFLVTVTLVNRSRPTRPTRDAEVEAMLFQCGFTVSVEDGRIGAYPTISRFSRHEEDEELALIYRSRATYGIGHGCAVTWEASTPSEAVATITAEPFPSYEVKALTNRIAMPPEARQALDLRWLASEENSTQALKAALSAFIACYSTWMEGETAKSTNLPEEYRHTAERLLERQNQAVKRMKRGIAALCEGDPNVLRAFRLAQAAMATQFEWVRNRRGGPFELGSGRCGPGMLQGTTQGDDPPRWYPFQLGYQLLVIESLANPSSEDRDTVDLLWFPTGGGKTEAYLALAAFEMISRRLKYGDTGTAVLMRYTLRLLTSQQFERCATLVSVLETMRQDSASLLGDVPFRLGLWVGGQLTPNRLDNANDKAPGAVQLIDQLLEAETPENPFLLRACPRCGTRIVPERRSEARSHYGVFANASRFKMNCPDPRCELHECIPVSVVDEDLYRNPPTFLIGTIDKFARMVWVPESRALLGKHAHSSIPPSLIIQDELHLINGPLGSIAGGYEAGIETVLSYAGSDSKYLASTATIQRAREQCVALYGRTPTIFPPAGLDADDSFFSREDRESPGRTYLGIMGNGRYSSLTSLVQVSAAAALAPISVERDELLGRDTYWTQVIYHNSRQELGKTTTMLRDDVRTRLEVLDQKRATERNIDKVEELSASLKGGAVAEALERLQVEYPSSDTIDVVACTNMISVGVDIGRLGFMLVKGQPKTTAEYIQASSRVGREHRRPPGIVTAIYSPLRPRDRSHYESFQSYHQALYRSVEPSSVTPYSPPARLRTLHAGLVLALRHLLGWTDAKDAKRFDPTDEEQGRIIAAYKARVRSAAQSDERNETEEHIDSLVSDWCQAIHRAGDRPLSFMPMRQYENLLTTYPSDAAPEGLWPTLNSMRHVDRESPFAVRGQGYAQGNGQ